MYVYIFPCFKRKEIIDKYIKKENDVVRVRWSLLKDDEGSSEEELDEWNL